MRFTVFARIAIAGTMLGSVVSAFGAAPLPAIKFRLHETSIESIRHALLEGIVTCEAVVLSYQNRIKKLDKAGELPINSIIAVNPFAVVEAREIDRKPRRKRGALACAPLIVKDNIDVAGMATTAGNARLKDNIAAVDAVQVARLRAAGAIVIAKANLAELAWTPDDTESALGGKTRNPYDLQRTPGGSSGGTAAALAANFGVAGLGTDTGASIRGPSSLQNLVGLRPTMGASSRSGVVPIWLSRDVVGPMARSVSDVARLYEVAHGYDPRDASTQSSRTAPKFDANAVLVRGSLKGMRIGVMRQMVQESADPAVFKRFEEAIAALRNQGAVITDLEIVNFKELSSLDWPNRMEYDVNLYLHSQGGKTSSTSFADIANGGTYDENLTSWLKSQIGIQNPQVNPLQTIDEQKTAQLRTAIVAAMDREFVSLVVYPSWTRPPRRFVDLRADGGNNNAVFAHAGLPAVTVPMGNTEGELPTGLQFGGRPFSEDILLGAAFDFEQATHHRTAPKALPFAELAP